MTSFCIAIQAEIVLDTCPLEKGRCYWQHAESHDCKYTAEELTVKEFCDLVGRSVPTDEELQGQFTKLRDVLTTR